MSHKKLTMRINYVFIHFNFSAKHKSSDFSLLSYNVLAQELLEKNSFLYNWSDGSVLKWEYRRSILFDEIRQFNADVSIVIYFNSEYF